MTLTEQTITEKRKEADSLIGKDITFTHKDAKDGEGGTLRGTVMRTMPDMEKGALLAVNGKDGREYMISLDDIRPASALKKTGT